ncbi:MAG: winged helix-turn-helix transcriptional regulator [Acidobacteriaceae bacterium]|nr:winged helix-turn-helix transcriptional regulator [Acidobacteriaceae bacterium]
MDERYKATFGAFELRLDTRELYKHGVRVRLQGKPFRILRALVLRPNEVVTREELRTELWSSDTFVDFESGLNTAVNRLRQALGDSAESPVYIETLARIGYRFIAPITVARKPDSQAAPRPSAGIATSKLPARLPNHWRWYAVTAAVLVGATAIALWSNVARPSVSFRPLTFQRGFVSNARFTPDGKKVFYSARWNGDASHLFQTATDASGSRAVGSSSAWLAAVSKDQVAFFEQTAGTHKAVLEAMPLRGGAPRPISEQAMSADWARNGNLCVVTMQPSTYSVECPAGHPIYKTSGWISDLRASPSGNQVAFWEHPLLTDDAGQLVVLETNGRSHVLSRGWGTAQGLAWHPAENEIWFTAARSGIDRALMAVTLSGRTRQIAQMPGGIRLLDISHSGEVLISRATPHMMMLYGKLSENATRNVALLDWSRAAALTCDGQHVLFDESGAGGGKTYSVYVYDARTRSSDKLGEGRAFDLSADGRWALSQQFDDPHRLALISTADRKTAAVSNFGFEYIWAKFLPAVNGPEILFQGNAPEEAPQIYRQHLPDGKPQLVKAGLQLYDGVLNPQGRFVAGVVDESRVAVLDLAHGDTQIVQTPRRLSPVAFMAPGRLLTSHTEYASIVLDILDLDTGKVTPYKRLDAPDPAGGNEIFPIHLAHDLDTYIYSRVQTLSQLYSVSGWS